MNHKTYLNINQLRYFYLSAKLKSISRAAGELMVTPPAVTMQIKQLENTLDLRLMYRKGNSISLTEIGERVFEISDRVFSRIEDMEVYLENISNVRVGNLRIGSHQTIAKYILPRFISDFNSRFPEIKILLSTGTTDEIIKKVLNHDIDLGIVVERPEETGVVYKKIGDENILLIASSGSLLVKKTEISIEELSSMPFILRENGTSVRFIVNSYFQKNSIQPNILMQLSSHHLIKKFVQKDIGVSFLEEFAVIDELERNELKAISIKGGGPKIDLGICFLKREILPPAAEAFLGMLERDV